MTLGQQIAQARKQKGLTQEALAEQLGVSRQAVAKWESGKAMPGTANLFTISQILEIPLTEAQPTAVPQPPKARSDTRRLVCLAAVLLLLLAIPLAALLKKSTCKIILNTPLQADDLQPYPEINALLEMMQSYGDGLYYYKLSLPQTGGQGTTQLFLIYRHGVTDDRAPKITKEPWHLRFLARYQSGTAEQVDLLAVATELDDYTEQIQILGTNQIGCCVWDVPHPEALAQELAALLDAQLSVRD